MCCLVIVVWKKQTDYKRYTIGLMYCKHCIIHSVCNLQLQLFFFFKLKQIWTVPKVKPFFNYKTTFKLFSFGNFVLTIKMSGYKYNATQTLSADFVDTISSFYFAGILFSLSVHVNIFSLIDICIIITMCVNNSCRDSQDVIPVNVQNILLNNTTEIFVLYINLVGSITVQSDAFCYCSVMFA